MENLLEHASLSRTAVTFVNRVLAECPDVFRPREMFWQLKLLSRYSAERVTFEQALAKKSAELEWILPHVRLSLVPPHRSTPLSRWRADALEWPDPVAVISQVFLQQILSSSELFLDLGSRADAFFLSEKRDTIYWVPETTGTRWHEPFRAELARLYLGWAFDQERLIDRALENLHLSPLRREIAGILIHWRDARFCSPTVMENNVLQVFKRAEELGLHLHPNVLVWGLYELEVVEVMTSLNLRPNLEQCADELCRLQSRISA